jgi:hypothetical protein
MPTSIPAKHHKHSLNTSTVHFYPLTLQDDISNTLPYCDWSYNKRVLISLADQFTILRNKLKFPLQKNTNNVIKCN